MSEQHSSGTEESGLLSAAREFVQLESAGGLLLLIAAVAALLFANSPLAAVYAVFLDTTVAVQVGALEIDKPLLLWINDGLMAVFFFLIGLEIKREFMEGELRTPSQIVLPALGALGGMVVPAAVYIWFNLSDPIALEGWAIPVATDIAFALALLGVFGSRVPPALKVFLLTLAIFDDLAAIVIIAVFYSGDLSISALLVAAAALSVAFAMNRLGVVRTSSYVLLGIVLWVALLKSSIHATLAGVLLAFCIPMRDTAGHSPLRELEHNLHGPVAFAILPIFAFANAGISLTDVAPGDLFHTVTTGIVASLLIGKPLGIVLFVAVAVFAGFARLPKGVTWPQLAGVGCACGIGFTMSLFIAGLAFERGSGEYLGGDRIGIVVGSVLSALAAALILRFALPAAGSRRNAAARQRDG